jgi:hypothetical protein
MSGELRGQPFSRGSGHAPDEDRRGDRLDAAAAPGRTGRPMRRREHVFDGGDARHGALGQHTQPVGQGPDQSAIDVDGAPAHAGGDADAIGIRPFQLHQV